MSSFTLTLVPSYAGKCRLVRGFLVGTTAADPDLWGFCGTQPMQEPASREVSTAIRKSGRRGVGARRLTLFPPGSPRVLPGCGFPAARADRCSDRHRKCPGHGRLPRVSAPSADSALAADVTA